VLTENDISRIIVDAAIEAHRTLGGPGLVESAYEEALSWEIEQRGVTVRRQVSLPIPYKGQTLPSPLRIDVLVGDLVITYLRLTGLRLGFVINFGERLVRDGIHRVVNQL
jgi:GxxExxY protein